MNRRKVIYCAILIVIVLLAWYAYHEYNRTSTPTSELKSDYNLSASVLINEFEQNDSISEKKYLGKTITVTGMLKKVEPENSMLLLGDSTSSLSIRCSLDSTVLGTAASLRPYTVVSIKGNCIGFNRDELLGSDVLLNHAIILKSKTN
ncbi:MAG TPA: hypothetical protein VM012_11920 [Flavitalea sp.]|nr:hypothetical protein [Flavitalea sp.]